MNKEEFIEKIKEIKVNTPDEDFFLEYSKEVHSLLDDNEKLNRDYYNLKSKIDKAEECIKNFLCSEEYINVDGIAIANNYAEILKILRGDNDE